MSDRRKGNTMKGYMKRYVSLVLAVTMILGIMSCPGAVKLHVDAANGTSQTNTATDTDAVSISGLNAVPKSASSIQLKWKTIAGVDTYRIYVYDVAKKAYKEKGRTQTGAYQVSGLAKSGNEVIVVDKDEKKVKEMRQYTDCAFVTDDLSADTLKEIGIQNCDVVIICIGEKVDVSVLTTMSVIELGVPRVIAKALSPEQGAVLEKIGAEVVYPERDMALRLGKKLLSNNFLDYVSLCNQVEIRQIRVPNHLIGKSIEETEIRHKYRLNIIAIENGDETDIEVMPDYRLRHGDIIVVIGKVDNIDVFVNEI